MKLIIQIPCFNEEASLPATLADLPRSIAGIDVVEWLVIDDGSSDQTVEVARRHGVDHVVTHPRNLGLARAFMSGLEAALELGADVIVNTDADNQYSAASIPQLVSPIVEKQADIVIGARAIDTIERFSRAKKILQRIGSWTVRLVSGTDIPDAPSGFRAFSRDAAARINVYSNYTYTLETIIQAGKERMAIAWIPVETNDDLRPSRLVRGSLSYIGHSIATIVRIFVVYKPFQFFVSIGGVLLSLGGLVGARFLYFYLQGAGQGHVQSLILASILVGIGFQTIMVGFVADLLGVNRSLLEALKRKSRSRRSD
jgi:glycosyltransferase involved in cell wall biosynthesis